ncbi:MAG: hypothetical protein AVDCRST_MAG35-359, partial [uncultured Quadrisphaera sp.]
GPARRAAALPRGRAALLVRHPRGPARRPHRARGGCPPRARGPRRRPRRARGPPRAV